MTTTVTPSGDRREAFAVLREIAQDAASRGRLAYAASAKPLMRQKLGFDETALNYSTFRELLVDAEAAGFLRLKYVLGGDVELTPGEPDTLASEPAAEPTRGAEGSTDDDGREERVFIRRDFWQTAVKPGQWWYDRGVDAVVRAASAPSGSDLIKMPDLGDETQGPWVEEFVHTLSRPRQEALVPALANALDVAGKTSLLRAQPQTVRNSWFNFLSMKVAARFEEWKSENDLTVRITMPPRPPRKDAVRTGSAPPPRGTLAGGRSENAVRERLHHAIERMPLSDLLRLSVPVEFLIES